MDDWNAALEKYVKHRSPEEMREQSDLFLQALERMDEQELEARLSMSRHARWSARPPDVKVKFTYSAIDTYIEKISETNDCLLQLFIIDKGDKLHTPEQCMGIACKAAYAGDRICRINGHDLAVVVWREDEYELIVGYAGLVMDTDWVKDFRSSPMRNSVSFDLALVQYSLNFPLYMDDLILYEMSK